MPDWKKKLIKRCQSGDLCAYDQLMQRYEKKVYALCYRMSGSKDDAADLAQETFLKLFGHYPCLKDKPAFSTWHIMCCQHMFR